MNLLCGATLRRTCSGSPPGGARQMYISRNTSQGPSRRNLHEQIAHDIGRQIAHGDFGENDLLPTEVTLASQYQVSRTAVREAFRILAAKGMTHSRPKIGTRVRLKSDWNMLDVDVLSWHLGTALDASFVRAVFEMRRLFEPAAAAMASQRRDETHLKAMAAVVQVLQRPNVSRDTRAASEVAFRYVLLEAADNPFFRSIGTVAELAIKLGQGLVHQDGNTVAFDQTEMAPPDRHPAILDAIRRRDAAAAEFETATAIEEMAALIELRVKAVDAALQTTMPPVVIAPELEVYTA